MREAKILRLIKLTYYKESIIEFIERDGETYKMRGFA